MKAQGADGTTPHVGENGNWYLGGTDTGVKAQGVDGPQGPAGPQGPKGDSGLMEEVYATTPQRIGTWIDGKPLYRRVFQYDGTIPAKSPSSANEEEYVNVLPNSQLGTFNRIIRLYGVITSGSVTMSFPHSRFTAFFEPVYGIKLRHKMTGLGKDLFIIVEYV